VAVADLAVIFQPGILSHPDHHMIPAEHTRNQKIVEFLVTHVDDFAPLLESRLKENPYRRKPAKVRKAEQAAAAKPASTSSSSGRLPFTAQTPVRPAMPTPRATRLSDTFAASESDDDDDFPGAVIVRVNDPKATQAALLARSKSTTSSNKSPRGNRRVSGKSVLDDLSLTPATEPASPGGLSQTSVRRRATAPSRRSATDSSGARRRQSKEGGDQPRPPPVKEVAAV